jgi:hypothetical protein
MGNSRLYVFTEYLPVSQSANSLQAFQQFLYLLGLGASAFFWCGIESIINKQKGE